MRQVPVNMAWIVNAFENSSQYSEYFLDMQTGDVKFFAPMDFPEHQEAVKKLNKMSDRYVRLPKINRELSFKTRRDYVEMIEDPHLKGLLENALDTGLKFRNALMEYGEVRTKWYEFQNKRYADYLKNWFKKKDIELVEKPSESILDYNKRN